MAGLVPAIHVFDYDRQCPAPGYAKGFAEASSTPARRSFSEGGKAGHDGNRLISHRLHLYLALRQKTCTLGNAGHFLR